MRVIEAGDLRLEPQVAAHADEMFGVLSDPAIYRYENSPPPSVDWLRERFARLEARRSPDGTQAWLNWVVRLEGAGLVGYVQATVLPGGRASIAYVFSSAHWGRSLARRSVEAMIAELAEGYGARSLFATLKRDNLPSLRLLERLGFAPAPERLREDFEAGPDELLMARPARG